jgi:Zn-dependent protease with chaperone function
VSRFLLLFLFLIWMAWRAEGDTPAAVPATNLVLFFGVFVLMIAGLAAWSRLLALRTRLGKLQRGNRYFNRVILGARWFIPIWFGVGVFFLGWGDTVQRLLGPVSRWPVQLPGAILGTLPALIAWGGLSWSQYPADRALRERSMLARFDDGQPIFQEPSLWDFLTSNLRMQVLFTSVPILLILAAHDVIMLVLSRVSQVNVEQSSVEGIVTFCSAIGVFLVVPEILVRVLPTLPLPPSPLRDRMEVMCRAQRLKFSDILIWQTHYRIANALVMGIIPRFRYVLLSDLLLEEMNDEQIEAVFAHELGHVVHRHLIWYLVFFKVLILALAAIGLILGAQQHRLELPAWMPVDLVTTLIWFGGFLIAFGYVSRRFERQADVFAARTLERHLAPSPGDQIGIVPAPRSHVGPAGASVFASALHKVALINNMPIEPTGRWEGNFTRRLGFVMERIGDVTNNWLHGSIGQRMRTLHRMSTDPAHTHHFDKRMLRLYVVILAALVVSGTLVCIIK